jgi:hypothetical protein
MTAKMLTYAVGRGLAYYDRPVVRAVARDVAQHEYRFSALVVGIVNSTPFRMRTNPAPEAGDSSRATTAP